MTPNRLPIYRVNIADGFSDDCEELIHRCIQQETVTYHSFCEKWKDMKLYSLFYGRFSGAELAELSEEVLLIAKQYMTADTSNFEVCQSSTIVPLLGLESSLEETVVGLFLVYALLNLQPYSNFAAVRFIPEDVAALEKIESVARRERRYDVLYVLGSILIRGPSQYHAAQRERGFETPIRKYLEGCMSIDKLGVRPKGVFFRHNEEMELLRDLNSLSKQYTQAKTLLFRNEVGDRNLMYANTEMPKQLETSIKQVINGLIDEDRDNAQPVVEISEHYTKVQTIKEKAMKQTVDSVKHLTGVKQRKSKGSSPKSDLETSPTKSITSQSPDKSQTQSPKSKKEERPKARVRTKRIVGATNIDSGLVEILCPEISAKNEDQMKDVESSTSKVDLPELNVKEPPEKVSESSRNDSETSSSSTEVENREVMFKKPRIMKEKKHLKKVILKSKFKRLGMLKVADFQENN